MNHTLKNIIFDFGGVSLPVDPMAYAGGMIDLGCKDMLALHETFLKEEVYKISHLPAQQYQQNPLRPLPGTISHYLRL